MRRRDVLQGSLVLAALSALETHLWERQALGRMLKVRLRCLLPEEKGGLEGQRENGLGSTWGGGSAWHSGRRSGMLPLIVSVSRAEQDMGRTNCLWSPCGSSLG